VSVLGRAGWNLMPSRLGGIPTVGSTLELVRDELVTAGAGGEGRLRSAIETVGDATTWSSSTARSAWTN
jgi:hypothetical protein